MLRDSQRASREDITVNNTKFHAVREAKRGCAVVVSRHSSWMEFECISQPFQNKKQCRKCQHPLHQFRTRRHRHQFDSFHMHLGHLRPQRPCETVERHPPLPILLHKHISWVARNISPASHTLTHPHTPARMCFCRVSNTRAKPTKHARVSSALSVYACQIQLPLSITWFVGGGLTQV